MQDKDKVVEKMMTDDDFIKELELLEEPPKRQYTISVFYCPNDPGHDTFLRRAAVIQLWRLAASGEYLEDADSGLGDAIVDEDVRCEKCGELAKTRQEPIEDHIV